LPNGGIGRNVDDSIIVLFYKEEMPLQIKFALGLFGICSCTVHCPGIRRNANDWVAVLVSALCCARAAAYAAWTDISQELSTSRADNFDVKIN